MSNVLLFLRVKTATLLGSMAILILDPSGAMNCFSWLFIDLRLSLYLEDVLVLNQFATALTGEVGWGSDPAAVVGGLTGRGTAGGPDWSAIFWIFWFFSFFSFTLFAGVFELGLIALFVCLYVFIFVFVFVC